MRCAERGHRPRRQSACLAGCWILLATVAVALAVGLSLPAGWQYDADQVGEVFRPEWLVLATLAVFPVHRASRACCWMLVPAVSLPMLQLFFAVETAHIRLESAGLAGGWVEGWWLLPAAQLLVFLAAGCSGAVASLRDRRWERFMRRRLGRRPGAVDAAFDLAA
jgi:hypothetical protein